MFNPLLILIVAIVAYVLYQNKVTGDDATLEMVARIKRDYFQDASDASREFSGIGYRRILAIIAVESGGAPEAIGSIGERGLMQITRDALTDFNAYYVQRATWDELLEERVNIFVGTGYLKILLNNLGNLDKATRAYNVGASNVVRNENSGLDYLQKVLYYESLI